MCGNLYTPNKPLQTGYNKKVLVHQGYTKTAFSGFSWQSFLKLTTSAVVVVKIFFLARMLTPEDFGIFSLVAICLGLSEAVTQTGVNVTIVQSKHKVSYFLNTAWVIAIVRGFLIAVLMTLMGIAMSHYFANQQLLFFITLSALVPIIKGFINPAIIDFHKNMRFAQDSIYKLSLIVVEVLSAILLALIIKSALAMVLAIIISAIFEVIISFLFLTEKPQFSYLPSRAKEIFTHTKWLNLASLFHYLNDNVDDLIIGKLTGTHQLGLYHNAYSLSHKLNYELSKSAHHSTFPILAKIDNDKERLKKAFFKSLLITSAIALIASLPLLIFPRFIVNLILSAKWLGVLPYIRQLTLAGIIHAVSNYSYVLLLNQKKYVYMNSHLFLTLVLSVVLMLLLTPTYGLAGAINGLLLARLITLPVMFFFIQQTFAGQFQAIIKK